MRSVSILPASLTLDIARTSTAVNTISRWRVRLHAARASNQIEDWKGPALTDDTHGLCKALRHDFWCGQPRRNLLHYAQTNLSVRRFGWPRETWKVACTGQRRGECANWAHCLSCIVQGFSRASLETRESLRPLSFPQTEQGHKEIQV